MNKTSIPTYRRAKEGKVLLTMTLDHRNGSDKEMPVCVRVGIGTLRRYFLMPGERYALEEFASIINAGNRKQGPKRKEFDDFFEKIKREVKKLIDGGDFSSTEFMEKLKAKINGLKEEEEAKGMTIYDVWEQLLNELENANRIGTRKSYLDSYKRFKIDMGEKVSNSSINQQLVDRWVAKMQNPKAGKAMSQTTIGIYLRAFRVVVRRAASMGVLLNDKMDLFKGVKDVNRKGERKEWCLNVEKMTKLYEFFDKGETKDQEGNELYDPQYKKRLFHSLGLLGAVPLLLSGQRGQHGRHRQVAVRRLLLQPRAKGHAIHPPEDDEGNRRDGSHLPHSSTDASDTRPDSPEAPARRFGVRHHQGRNDGDTHQGDRVVRERQHQRSNGKCRKDVGHGREAYAHLVPPLIRHQPARLRRLH